MKTRVAWCLPLLLVGLAACSDDDGGANNNTLQDAGGDATVDAAVDAAPQGLILDLGEVAEATADEVGTVTIDLATPEGTEAYLLLVHSRNHQVNALRTYAADLVARPSSKSGKRPAEPLWNCLGGARQLDLGEIAGRLRGLPVPRGVLPAPPPPPLPGVGDTLTFAIDGTSGLTSIDASVLLVTDALVVALDRTTDPTITLDATVLAQVAEGFEAIVLPRERIFFGEESDVNGDGHVTVLFSPLVYEVGATAYVNPYDLLTDPDVIPVGVAANAQELIYVTPPSLLEPYMATPRALLETLAHEFQHAIYFYRKYLLNDLLDDTESVYLTEGYSALAQDLTGYQAGNFFVSKAGLDDVDQVSANDLIRSSGGYIQNRDGALRGGAYLLVRYLYDQAGGDGVLPDGTIDLESSPGVAWLRGLVDAPLLGAANLEAAAGRPLDDVVLDWFTALMVDDRTDASDLPLNADPRWNYLPTAVDPLTSRTRGTTMFESFAGMVSKTGPAIVPWNDADGTVRAGGAEYLSLEAAAPGRVTLTFTGDPVDAALVVRIFRVQ